MNSLTAERNRIRRRDKKVRRRKDGMRVDDSAKKLARIKLKKVEKMYEAPLNIWPGMGMPGWD